VKTDKTKDGVVIAFGKGSDRVERAHLDKILRGERHPYKLEGYCETEQKGTFHRVSSDSNRDDGLHFSKVLETRLLSYATEERFPLVRIEFSDSVTVFVESETMASPEYATMLGSSLKSGDSFIAMEFSGTRRGIAERACGMWVISALNQDGSKSTDPAARHWTRFQLGPSKAAKSKIKILDDFARKNAVKSISFRFPWKSTDEQDELKFFLHSRGVEEGVAGVDLRDLLASPRVHSSIKTSFDQQRVVFPLTSNSPLLFKGQDNTATLGDSPSWERPLVKACIPEGARILSVLASGRRREHVVRLPSFEDKGKKSEDSAEEDSAVLDLHLDSKQTGIGRRWKRFSTDSVVYVDTNSVPATCLPLNSSEIMYCCCANTLEVRGGGLRAEGLTLLPPGKMFLLLCRMTFGLFKQENVDDGSLVPKATKFVDPDCNEVEKELMAKRFLKAVAFHFSATQLESKLECFPSKISELLDIFNMVDGYECSVWKELESNPFVAGNLKQHRNGSVQVLVKPRFSEGKRNGGRNGEKTGSEESSRKKKASTPEGSRQDAAVPNNEKKDKKSRKKKVLESETSDQSAKGEALDDFLKNSQFTKLAAFFEHERKLSQRLFASTPAPGEELTENDLPSSNIMAIVIDEVRSAIGDEKRSNGAMSLDSSDWEVFTTTIDASVWFIAFFIGTDLPYIQRTSKVAAWLKQTDVTKVRPTASSAAASCVPPSFSPNVKSKLVVLEDGKEVLVFESLELAVRMEAAFWLERQFLQGKRHWYQQTDVFSMANRLKTECKSEMKRTGKEIVKKAASKSDKSKKSPKKK